MCYNTLDSHFAIRLISSVYHSRGTQDPFRGGDNILVLCETCLPTGEPIPSNTRAKAREAFDAAPGFEPWFGIEQEYTLFDKDLVSNGKSV